MEVFVAMLRNSALYPKSKGKVPESCKQRRIGRICILERCSDCWMEAREVVGNSVRKSCKQWVIRVCARGAILDIDGRELCSGLYQ